MGVAQPTGHRHDPAKLFGHCGYVQVDTNRLTPSRRRRPSDMRGPSRSNNLPIGSTTGERGSCRVGDTLVRQEPHPPVAMATLRHSELIQHQAPYFPRMPKCLAVREGEARQLKSWGCSTLGFFHVFCQLQAKNACYLSAFGLNRQA